MEALAYLFEPVGLHGVEPNLAAALKSSQQVVYFWSVLKASMNADWLDTVQLGFLFIESDLQSCASGASIAEDKNEE